MDKKEKQDKVKQIRKVKEKKFGITLINSIIFTKDDKDFVSKRELCNLLNEDYKDRKVIRLINDTLSEYEVVYDKNKCYKGDYGFYQGIKLKEITEYTL